MPPVFDGHNDALLGLDGRPFFERSSGDLDYPKAREGGFAGGLFAAFVPNPDFEHDVVDDGDGYEADLPPPLDPAYARERTVEMLARLHRLAREGPLRVCQSAAEIEETLGTKELAAVAHLEGAAAVGEDLAYLDLLYAAGVRSVGPVWSRPNAFGEGVRFAFPASPDTGGGLTEAGRRLVAACDDRGIVVDCAHLTERGFEDVAATTENPLVVTHAGAHALSPSSRNLTDEQLRTVADSGGVVGVSFGTSTLREDGAFDADTPVERIADHVAYVADTVGVDHVAFGSDFDGAPMPDGLDAAGLPRVLEACRERGVEGEALRKIAHGNWLRVLRAVL